jgi:hypothetical protein
MLGCQEPSMLALVALVALDATSSLGRPCWRHLSGLNLLGRAGWGRIGQYRLIRRSLEALRGSGSPFCGVESFSNRDGRWQKITRKYHEQIYRHPVSLFEDRVPPLSQSACFEIHRLFSCGAMPYAQMLRLLRCSC